MQPSPRKIHWTKPDGRNCEADFINTQRRVPILSILKFDDTLFSWLIIYIPDNFFLRKFSSIFNVIILRDTDLIMLLTGVCSIKWYYELDAIIYIHCIDSLIRRTYILYLYYIIHVNLCLWCMQSYRSFFIFLGTSLILTCNKHLVNNLHL